MTPLAVCLVTTFYPPYSADEDGIYVQGLANALAKAGHKVTVVHNPSAIGVLRRSEIRTPSADHPTIRNVPMATKGGWAGLLALHQSGRPWGLRRRLSLVFEQRFDVIHFHNVSLMGGPGIFGLGSAEVRLAGLNDHWLVCPTHLLWKWNDTVCDRPTCVSCCIRQHRPPQWWRALGLMRSMTEHVDAFLGASHLTIRAHRERGLERPMIHLPLLHVGRAQRLPRDEVIRGQYFLCTGKLVSHKGFQHVIPVFRRLPDYTLVVCGQGRMLTELRRLANDLPNVLFKDDFPQTQVDALYRDAVATIVPTLSYQTFCHTTAASYANGTPVIGRRHGVVEELISAFGGGLLYSDADELVQAVKATAIDRDLRNRLARAAAGVFEAQFSEKVYLRRYVSIIEELRSRKAGAGSIGPQTAQETQLAGRPVYW